VFAKDGLPENKKLGGPPEITAEKIQTWGLDHVVPGNTVIIEHANHEFSFMAHLKKGSITVKEGQEVKQGEVIGKLGNTGNSTAPHLHYHLMDKESTFTGRSIPIKFENINLISNLGMEPSHPEEDFEFDINALIDPVVIAE